MFCLVVCKVWKLLLGAYMIVSYKPVYRGIILPLTATSCKQVFIFLESNAGVLNCLMTGLSPLRYTFNIQGSLKVMLLFSVSPAYYFGQLKQ